MTHESRIENLRHCLFVVSSASAEDLAEARAIMRANLARHERATRYDPRVCLRCGLSFVPRDNRQVYCTETCGTSARQFRHRSKKYDSITR